MPSGGATALKEKDMAVVWEHFRNAEKYGLTYEWLQWFAGGLYIDKMDPTEAACAATIEWDL